MKASVYIESSVISYLTARPSRDVVTSARQALTEEWWKKDRHRFDVYISALVEEEIASGDSVAAQQRLEAVTNIPGLDVSDEAMNIAQTLIAAGALPKNSEEDALHIGIAAANGVEYLLTWNFKHLNNAEKKKHIINVVEAMGCQCPLLCSPEELGVSL